MAFAVVYRFDVKEGREDVFESSWRSLTELIYKYEGSLGSRLHKHGSNHYIAYALWPSREKWKGYGSSMPEKSQRFSEQMHEACNSIEVLYELDVVEDLLQ
ncbi:MAG: antibiotic biosynthesis monooxygenase [Vicingaceae bacterium]